MKIAQKLEEIKFIVWSKTTLEEREISKIGLFSEFNQADSQEIKEKGLDKKNVLIFITPSVYAVIDPFERIKIWTETISNNAKIMRG